MNSFKNLLYSPHFYWPLFFIPLTCYNLYSYKNSITELSNLYDNSVIELKKAYDKSINEIKNEYDNSINEIKKCQAPLYGSATIMSTSFVMKNH